MKTSILRIFLATIVLGGIATANSQTATQRETIEPNNPEAYYTISTYYWDKAYRDTKLKEPEKRQFIMDGLDAVNKALQLKSDYMEALVYKNLLLRSQALIEKDPAKQQALLKEADQLRDRAQELRKKKAAGVGD